MSWGLREQIKELKKENAVLREQIDSLIRGFRMYGDVEGWEIEVAKKALKRLDKS